MIDAVLREDVDTMMFGLNITLCRWSLHNQIYVDMYKAEITKQQTSIDDEGMILIALISGRDYFCGISECGSPMKIASLEEQIRTSFRECVHLLKETLRSKIRGPAHQLLVRDNPSCGRGSGYRRSDSDRKTIPVEDEVITEAIVHDEALRRATRSHSRLRVI